MLKKLCSASLLLPLTLAAQLVTFPTIDSAPQSSPSASSGSVFSGSLVTIPNVKPISAAPAPQTTGVPWTSKRMADWSDQDAYLILSNSPWAKPTAATLARLMTEDQRRDGGDMNAQGGGHGGVGLENALNPFGTRGAIVRPGEGPEAQRLSKLTIRWESAMPVQAAEIRTHDNSAPELNGEDYTICVYNVNLKLASIEDMKTLDKDLNRLAVLKIEGRGEVRSRKVVSVLMGDGMANVVYFFPRSAHITADDQRIEFNGQIGRILFATYFYPPEMKLLGKLEL